jgi:hypothetical protein
VKSNTENNLKIKEIERKMETLCSRFNDLELSISTYKNSSRVLDVVTGEEANEAEQEDETNSRNKNVDPQKKVITIFNFFLLEKLSL